MDGTGGRVVRSNSAKITLKAGKIAPSSVFPKSGS